MSCYHAVSKLSSNNGPAFLFSGRRHSEMTRNGIPATSSAREDIWGRSALAAKVEEDDQQPGFIAVKASCATSWRARYLLANRGQG